VTEHGDPIPGYYRLKLIKGGPWVGARIVYGPPPDPIDGTELDRAPRWQAWLDGKMIGADRDPHRAGAFRIWPAHSIEKAEYEYLIANSQWAKANSPNDPAANPGRPIDLLTAPIPF
jgi:hypothetical protein